MTGRKTLDQMTSDDLDQLYADLAALRAVARGYCPSCGRGDAAPTVTDWETERRRADQLAATVREILDAFEAYWARASYCGPGQASVQPEHFRGWRATLTPPSPPATEATEGFEYGCPSCSEPVPVGKRTEHQCAEQSPRTTANNSPTSSNATDNALAGVIQVATSRYKAEQGEPAPVLEALGYHAMGQGIDLERLTIQRDQLADDLRYALADHGPRHNHLQPGVWDDTLTPCQHCQRLEQARQNLAALNPQKEPTP